MLGGFSPPPMMPGVKLWLKAHPEFCFTEPSDPATHSEIGGFAGQFTAADSEYLNIADNATLRTGNIDFTWAAWVYLDSEGAFPTILAKWDTGTSDREYEIDYESSTDRFRAYVRKADDSGNIDVITNTFGAVTTGAWYFLVFSHDAVNDIISLSVNNGVSDTTAIVGGVRSGTAALSIGSLSNNSNTWNGRIASTGFWKRVLTAAERTWLYNAGKARLYGEVATGQPSLTTSLVSWWDLQEMSGTRNDSHGTNHLTDVNTVTRTAGPNAEAAAVGTWKDLSGNGNHVVQATAASKPLLTILSDGKYAVVFDGVDDYLQAALSTQLSFERTDPWTAVAALRLGGIDNDVNPVVAKDNGAAANGYIWNIRSAIGIDVALANLVGDRVFWRSSGFTNTVRSVTAFRYTGSSLVAGITAFQNGAEVVSTYAEDTLTASILNALKFTVGGSADGATAFLLGEIHELMIHTLVLSVTQRQRLERYLSRVWGVTVA